MGYDKYTQIGPYLKVSGSKIKQIEVITKTCTNIFCKKHGYKMDSTFCGECASLVGEVKFHEEKEITAKNVMDDICYEDYDGFEKFSETLVICGNLPVYINNRRAPFESNRIIDEDAEIDINLIGVNMVEEIEWFENEFKEVIDEINRLFGPESATVKWGVINYYG